MAVSVWVAAGWRKLVQSFSTALSVREPSAEEAALQASPLRSAAVKRKPNKVVIKAEFSLPESGPKARKFGSQVKHPPLGNRLRNCGEEGFPLLERRCSDHSTSTASTYVAAYVPPDKVKATGARYVRGDPDNSGSSDAVHQQTLLRSPSGSEPGSKESLLLPQRPTFASTVATDNHGRGDLMSAFPAAASSVSAARVVAALKQYWEVDCSALQLAALEASAEEDPGVDHLPFASDRESPQTALFHGAVKLRKLGELRARYTVSGIQREGVMRWASRVVQEFNWRRATFFVAVHALDSLVLLKDAVFLPNGGGTATCEEKRHNHHNHNFSQANEMLILPLSSVSTLLLGAMLVEDYGAIHRLKHFMRTVPCVTSADQVCLVQWDLLSIMPEGPLVSRTPEDYVYYYLCRLVHAPSARTLREAAILPVDDGRFLEVIVNATLLLATASFESGHYAFFNMAKLTATILTPLLANTALPALYSDLTGLEMLSQTVFRFAESAELVTILQVGIPLLITAVAETQRNFSPGETRLTPDQLLAHELLAHSLLLWTQSETAHCIRRFRREFSPPCD